MKPIEYNQHVVSSLALTIAIGSFNAGYQIGMLNSLKDLYMAKFHFSEELMNNYWGWTNLSLTLAAAISTLFAEKIVNKYGRMRMMHFVNLITIIGSIVIQFNGPTTLSFGRAILGFAMGLYFYLCPLYISEVAPPKCRGRYVSFHQLMIVIAIFLGAAFALFIPVTNQNDELLLNQFYRLIIFIPILSSISQSITLYFHFNIESPLYLYSTGNVEECKAALQKIYIDQTEIDRVVSQFPTPATQENKSSESFVSILKDTQCAVLLGCFISAAAQFTGVNSIMYYSTPVLKRIFDENLFKARLGTVFINAAQLLVTLLSVVLVDKAGRKVLLLIGCVGCGLSQLIFGYTYKQNASMTEQNIGMGMMISFISFFSISYGPVTWIYLSEIMHSKTLNVAVCLNLILTIMITAVTPILTQLEGGLRSILFYVYAAVMGFAFIILLKYMKETKGFTTEQAQQLFAKQKIRCCYSSYVEMSIDNHK